MVAVLIRSLKTVARPSLRGRLTLVRDEPQQRCIAARSSSHATAFADRRVRGAARGRRQLRPPRRLNAAPVKIRDAYFRTSGLYRASDMSPNSFLAVQMKGGQEAGRRARRRLRKREARTRAAGGNRAESSLRRQRLFDFSLSARVDTRAQLCRAKGCVTQTASYNRCD